MHLITNGFYRPPLITNKKVESHFSFLIIFVRDTNLQLENCTLCCQSIPCASVQCVASKLSLKIVLCNKAFKFSLDFGLFKTIILS